MASLYKSSSRARKFVVAFILIAIAVFALDSVINSPESTAPVVSESRYFLEPNRKFQTIPEFTIKSIDYNLAASFILESTFTTRFPDVAYIHEIERPAQKLNSVSDAQRTVGILGFDSATYEQPISDIYIWSKDDSTKVIEFNKTLQTWSLITSFFRNPTALANKKLYSSITSYETKVRTALTRLGFREPNIQAALLDIRYANLREDGIFEEKNRSEDSDFVFVNAFRTMPVADLKEDLKLTDAEKLNPPTAITGTVYKTDPRQGSLEMIVSNQLSDLEEDIFNLQFVNYSYIYYANNTERANYTIIKPEEAWNLIQNGKGSLTLLKPRNADYFLDQSEFQVAKVTEFRADARLTELGYYEPDVWDGKVYPIYIFRGQALLEDGNVATFVFYVDAIKRVS